ncbi:class I SAM-dependent methyltransferase [Candidatus Leptofilum sp.]|uniref:class I SAM-dependent methyltransferase n=1 Tax=Candidatus Leptofilum sp. TaxID=3241576 RepID=UPI003B5C193C
MSVQKGYDLWSAQYDADPNPTRDLDRAIVSQLLGELNVETILEVGCGTGKNTGLLAEIGESVTAVDFSPGMLAQAKAKITAPNVTFQTADITQPWVTPARHFDLITFNLILEHIEDLDFVLGQASRALKAGGQLFICELHPFKQYLGTQARFTQDEQTTLIPAFTHHISDYLYAAHQHGLTLHELKEWWDEGDVGKPPRLISFLFGK